MGHNSRTTSKTPDHRALGTRVGSSTVGQASTPATRQRKCARILRELDRRSRRSWNVKERLSQGTTGGRPDLGTPADKFYANEALLRAYTILHAFLRTEQGPRLLGSLLRFW